MTERKSDFVRRMVAEGNWKSALRVASDFKLDISPEDHSAMKRGYECLVHPAFYQSIRTDVPKSIDKAIQTVQRLYGT